MVKVSIVVPIYQVADYLPRCLDSLIQQTLTDIEIICVNDCSPDNSAAILATYASKDPRIIIINHEINQYTAQARNSGLDMATGEYIAFVDGDDYLDLDFCEKLYNLAESEQADIAKGILKTIQMDGTVQITDDTEIVRRNKFIHRFAHPVAIYKLAMLRQHQLRFIVDCIVWQMQTIYYANKIACRNDCYYNYVRHTNSCDTETFPLQKWLNLNVRGADLVLDFYNQVAIDPANYLLVIQNTIIPLYFYGFNKLTKTDVTTGAKIMADTLSKMFANTKDPDTVLTYIPCKYRQSLQSGNLIKLQTSLVRHHPHISWFDYIKYRLSIIK